MRTIIFAVLCTFNLFANDSSLAIQNAASENKHVFIFFYKEQNEKTATLQNIFDQAIQKMGSMVKSIKVKANDPSEKALIDRFNLKRSPMPFVVALAPNGAITGGYASFTEEQLSDSLSSPGAAGCLKALQERKLVLLCLQNAQTAHNEAALKGVNEFKADPLFANATEIVKIDPSDKNEQKFLNQLGINVTSQATTVLISPPAEVIGSYQGAISKDQLAADLYKATSGCCCPGGKCGCK